jgi:hypothetical protein
MNYQRKPWTAEDRAMMSLKAKERAAKYPRASALPPMTKEQKAQYVKMRRCGVGRKDALKGVGVTE